MTVGQNIVVWLVLILLTGLGTGCVGSQNAMYMTEERLANGLVVILPGIEGESKLNRNIRRGLASAGVGKAMPIYHWGRPIPGVGMLLNQMDFVGNRLAGVRIARMIEQYQDEHPDEPVYLVGHSGGGGIAVFAAEAMKEGRKVDGLVLLSASIWAGYDLSKALNGTRQGIVNFYNRSDVGLLAIGTTVTSNVDGMRGPSAGLKGFTREYPRLHQVPITGGGNPHRAATRPSYVRSYVAPWVQASNWPASRTLADKVPETPSSEGDAQPILKDLAIRAAP